MMVSTDYSVIFYAVAGFAVFFVAVAKAGFGGMIGSVAMPLLASVSEPVTAISVLLPTYVVMDLIMAWVYRRDVRFGLLWPMVVSGLVGVAVAGLMFRSVNVDVLGIVLGLISIGSVGRFFWIRRRAVAAVEPGETARHWPRIIGLNAASGFTSFFLMGEAPIQIYMLGLRLAPRVYVAVLIWFFFIVNWAKLPIVLEMGLVTRESLVVSALLLPVMPLGLWIGKTINARLPKEPFYFLAQGLLFLLGLYLIGNALLHLSGMRGA